MASSFMGLYVQREALVAAQKSLDITGNNISNIKTQGYARQRVDVCSVANKGYNLLYDTSVSMAGQGVDVVGVAQYRDALIDAKVRNYTTQYGGYQVKQKVMLDVETALDNIEADTSGFAVNLAKFKEAVQSFSSDHADRQELANVAFQAAQSVVQQINYMNGRLDDISVQTLSDAEKTVTKINTIFQNMAALNKQITDGYVQMGYIEMTNLNYQVENTYGPLELKDNLNVLIDELSEYGDVNFKEEYNGSMSIWFAGQLVVFNDQYAQMAMTEASPKPFDMGFEITNCGKYDADNERWTGLMKAEEWNRELIKKEMTVDQYVRSLGDNIDVTGNDKLSAGALRGYLDVYNGDGVYATDGSERALYKIANNTAAINDLTQRIADVYTGTELNEDDMDKLENLMGKLREYGDFNIEYTDPPTDFTVRLGRNIEVVNSGTAKTFASDKTSTPFSVSLGGTDVTADATATNKNLKNTYQGIEYYRDMLNSFVTTFSDKLNDIYKDFGFKLFDWGEDFHDAALNMRVTEDWKTDPSILAHPERFPASPTHQYEELDNTYIQKVLGVFADQSFTYGFKTADGEYLRDPETFNFEKFIAHISDNIGVQIEGNKKILQTTEIMLVSVTDARDELMGVSMDEEGVNMLNYQKWYNAIARMITTLDEALDKLINDTGLVGR